MPTRSLPEKYDIPRPYGPAPPERIFSVLAAYQEAREASSEAVARVAGVAEMTRAPCTVLTRARELAAESAPGWE